MIGSIICSSFGIASFENVGTSELRRVKSRVMYAVPCMKIESHNNRLFHQLLPSRSMGNRVFIGLVLFHFILKHPQHHSTVQGHPRIRLVNVSVFLLRMRREMPNLTAFVFRNGRYPTVTKVSHARPSPTEPERPPKLVPDSGGEAKSAGPGCQFRLWMPIE